MLRNVLRLDAPALVKKRSRFSGTHCSGKLQITPHLNIRNSESSLLPFVQRPRTQASPKALCSKLFGCLESYENIARTDTKKQFCQETQKRECFLRELFLIFNIQVRHHLLFRMITIKMILLASLAMIQAIQGMRIDTQFLHDWQRNHLDDRIPIKRSAGGFGGGDEVDGSMGDYDSRFLSIREAPPKRIEARQHGKVVLECSATGTPAPQITWIKDGRPLFKVSPCIYQKG